MSFYTVHEVLTASILGCLAIPSSSGSYFIIILKYDQSEYYKQLNVNKLDNLEEMNIFLEKYNNIPRLNQEDTGNLIKPIINSEIEILIEKLLANKSPGQDSASQRNYANHRKKKKLVNILFKLLQKEEEEHSETHSTRTPLL